MVVGRSITKKEREGAVTMIWALSVGVVGVVPPRAVQKDVATLVASRVSPKQAAPPYLVPHTADPQCMLLISLNTRDRSCLRFYRLQMLSRQTIVRTS